MWMNYIHVTTTCSGNHASSRARPQPPLASCLPGLPRRPRLRRSATRPWIRGRPSSACRRSSVTRLPRPAGHDGGSRAAVRLDPSGCRSAYDGHEVRPSPPDGGAHDTGSDPQRHARRRGRMPRRIRPPRAPPSWTRGRSSGGRNSSGSRPLCAQVVHVAHGLPQVPQPLLGMLAGEADAPGQRIGARSGDARIDERVKHLPLRLT